MKLHALLTVICLAWLFAWPAAARAEDDISRPFAPWMVLSQDMRSNMPALEEERGRESASRMRRKDASIPSAPVLTPQDTAAVIENIYAAEGAAPFAVSPAEKEYARRADQSLTQFGYDLLGATRSKDGAKEKGKADDANEKESGDKFAMPAGAVQDDFVLSIGDRLTVTFRGQRHDSKSYAVDSEGRLIIDELPPITAAGRTVGALRAELEEQAGRLYNTNIYVSLDAVRQVNVLVVGHTEKPGRQTLTVFHTVLDALAEAGGVQKTGSLRQIKLVRGGRSTVIDLYSLLIHDSTLLDISLRDGDRIIVPPLGPTVAIAGGVQRPGIYEILPPPGGQEDMPAISGEGQRLTLEDMLTLAGGVLSPGQNRFMKLGLTSDGRETVDEITDPTAAAFGAGSILVVAPSDEKRTGTVELTGHTRQPGIHALKQASSLSALLPDDSVFGPDIYPLVGVIERTDKKQLTPQLIAFPPLQVVEGSFDRKLQDGDIVHLFSMAQIRALQKKTPKNGQDGVHLASFTAHQVKDGADGKKADDMDDDEREEDDQSMMSFLTERSAFIRGAVRHEGAWPVADGATLENLIAVAGGFNLEASMDNIEIISRLQGKGHQDNGRSGTQRITVSYHDTDPSSVQIGPGDSVRVNQKFKRVTENSVLIIGEVDNPGRYDLTAGDKMSDLLERAGGLTRQAYPEGAIFSRESERRAEESRFRAQAQDLELRLAAALDKDKEEQDPNAIATVQGLVSQLRQAEAVGRITVESDPGKLAAQPELDILLEPGDRIYIPRRPLTVRVAGEILSPASLQFRKDKEPRDYIAEAGGFSWNADKDRVFVLYPDGSAQPLQVNAWNNTPVFVPPGSTIVVPRDPKPFDFIQTAKDVSQIISNLAITGIFLDDLKDGD